MNDSMILICVNNKINKDELKDTNHYYYLRTSPGTYPREYYFNLTIGKSYKKLSGIRWGSNDRINLIKVEDDNGYSDYLPKRCFKSLDEIRDEKINLILDCNKIK